MVRRQGSANSGGAAAVTLGVFRRGRPPMYLGRQNMSDMYVARMTFCRDSWTGDSAVETAHLSPGEHSGLGLGCLTIRPRIELAI